MGLQVGRRDGWSDGCMLGPVRFSSAETGGEMRTFLITLLKVVLALSLSFAIQ